MANLRNNASPDPLLNAVEACLRRHIQPQQTLVVAFSGGRDSVALLDALKALQADFAFGLQATHVHHGLSPHAREWEAFCREHCAAADVPLTVHAVTVARDAPEGLEAAARNVRYQALMRTDADWLVCAHHRGDQAETMLFNLLRGAGPRGAAAMKEVRPLSPNLGLIRPLLTVSRGQIDDYLHRRALRWIEDGSNLDTGFTRNFLRHDVLPVLASRFSAVEERLATAAQMFTEASVLLDELALIDLHGEPPRFPLSMQCLSRLTDARARNLLHFLLTRHRVSVPSQHRLVEALRQFKEASPDRHPAITFGTHRLRRLRGSVYLEPTSG